MKYLQIRSRHPTHDCLRAKIRTNGKRIVARFGSNTEFANATKEINTIEACMNSSNKRIMKTLFTEKNVKTAIWTFPQTIDELRQFITNNRLLDKKVIIKSLRGSRGRGLYLMETGAKALEWFQEKGFGGHIIEKFYNYNKEYRLHVSADGCFYTCRKMLKADADIRWYRNDSNCVWIREENPDFHKPSNWDVIVDQCVNALNAVGLDIGACDVRVQSERAGRHPDFIICEINSAPSFGDITADKYTEVLTKIIANNV